ncbi:MAG: SAM-dependent methyltransferase [Acidiferrobacterales bacterium]
MAALGYEILLMRLLSIIQWHHFAYMIISLALLGYGASGTLIAVARERLQQHFGVVYPISATVFALTMVIGFAFAQQIPFNALEIVWDPRQFIYLFTLYLLFFVPFLFAATCIGLAFVRYRQEISRIYFSDLLGAGAGAIGIIGILFLLRPEACLQLLAAFALAAAVLASLDRTVSVARWSAAAPVVIAVLLLLLPSSWLALRMSPYKGLQQATQVLGTKILSEHSSPLGLLTIVSSPTIPFRYAPGLSLKAKQEPPRQLAVFTDGDAMSVITRYIGRRETLAYLDQTTAALPYHLLKHPRVLVLGTGGGADVLLARYHYAGGIDAVELNPLIMELVHHTYSDFAGHVYDAPDVRTYVAEARGFVSRSQNQYDLIQVALMDSFAASSAGVQALSESYLYTVEAIQAYVQHLVPGGILAITRWLKLPPRDSLKLFATAVEALEGMGVGTPGRQLALIRSWKTSTLLVKNGEFTHIEINRIREFSRARSFDLAYVPGMAASEANRFNLLDRPYLYEATQALLGKERNAFLQRYKFYVAPATDDRPYFFHFFKWRALPELLALRTQGGAALIEWSYLILVATLVQAVIAGILLILLPLFVLERAWNAAIGTRFGIYFFALGLAFISVEIAFIQKFILFLHHPLYAVAVVLSGFLLFAGVGSGCSRYVARQWQDTGFSAITFAACGIAVISLLYIFFLPRAASYLAALPDVARVLIAFALIAPLAFCMGMPFPLGLSRVAVDVPTFIPWAWGINGFASVISAALATLVAIEFGFTGLVLLALAFYGLAAAVIGKTM